MIGVILAAGAGRRLRPYTDDLPKALVPLGDGRTVLRSTLHNFAEVGLRRAAVVVGYKAAAIERLVPELERETGLALELVHNDHAEDRNNAYSLWCARESLREGFILANGDTLHPVSVEHDLLAFASADRIALAVDTVKSLGDEEMKVELLDGTVRAISKSLPWDAAGEYIGVTWTPPGRVEALVDALERTWRADPQRYYEDAFQLLVDEGERIDTVAIGEVEWVEIDDHRDLARAEVLACRS
jgi:choline kinase